MIEQHETLLPSFFMGEVPKRSVGDGGVRLLRTSEFQGKPIVQKRAKARAPIPPSGYSFASRGICLALAQTRKRRKERAS